MAHQTVLRQTSDFSLQCKEVEAILAEGASNLVPIYKSVICDLDTPVSAFLKIQKGKHSFLFESVEGGEKQARYSFLGTNPVKVVTENEVDPMIAVEVELNRYKIHPVEGIPSFTGGAVGYIAYDCIRHFEPKVELPAKSVLGLPDSIFMYFNTLVVFDHLKHSLKVVSHVFADPNARSNDTTALYTAACASVDELIDCLMQPAPVLQPDAEALAASAPEPEMISNHGKDGFCGFVRDLRDHIVRGNLIQAVPSHRLARPLRNIHAFDIYRELRVLNPSPYMFYMDLGEFQVVGASPECLVKVENNRVTTHPIAGTRKRGATPAQDDKLAEELLACEKERAEHIMLVDLGRNDVGRVATAGTVTVDSLMKIERYSHVMHIVSQVSGELHKDKTIYDAFRSIFPAGTVSGAPKIRAMQLVGEMEGERRGVYAGAVGYVSFSQVLDVCISIRTLVVKEGVAHLQAGGGIVYDSEEEPEYKETIKKMRALAVAISNAEDRSRRLMGQARPSTAPPARLQAAVSELKAAYGAAKTDPAFQAQLKEDDFARKLGALLDQA